MRFQWILAILCTLVSMGLLVMIVHQRQVMLPLQESDLPMQLEKLSNHISNFNNFKDSMEKLLDKSNKELKDLDDSMARLNSEMEGKKADIDQCQGEKKMKDDEQEVLEQERTQVEANLKSESDVWNLEIKNLKAQLVGWRPICDYVKKDTLASKLCGTKETPVS